MSLRSMTEVEDKQFRRRVQGALETVRAWEDPALLLECRNSLDWNALRDPFGPYSRLAQDIQLGGRKNIQFVQRLCRYFQQSMTWVNNPPCAHCGDTNTTQRTVRGPESDAEKQGQASRVEVYDCPTCQAAAAAAAATTTTFPRYNNPKTLLQTKQGRCGEYANLFGLHCRAVGLSTRYILDVTDHVWVEVYVDGKWIMADGCEGVIDECSMYEAGWGKQLTCMIAVAIDHVIEVTPRYTRKFHDNDFMARRRTITSSEQAMEQILRQINESLRQGMSPKARQQVEKNCSMEEEILRKMRQLNSWDTKGSYDMGRISGSLAWKVARGEAGKEKQDDDDDDDDDDEDSSKTQKATPTHLHVETFYPPLQSSVVSIAVQSNPLYRHQGILVNGAPCAVGQPDTLSVVVVDEVHLGCVLQSRCFTTLQDFCEFVDSLPNHRIVAMNGVLLNTKDISAQCKSILSRLGGLEVSLLSEGVIFVGQVGALPDWATCKNRNKPGFVLNAQWTNYSNNESLHLRTLRNTKPARIIGRVPESVMPLQTQLLASHTHKRQAFESMKLLDDYAGYTTRPGAPIYLLNATAFPLESVDTADDDTWSTFIRLPAVLVPDDDHGIQDEHSSNNEKKLPVYEVPVDVSFFSNSVGNQLLVKGDDASVNLVDSAMALRNARLVGFYFSAHWCRPCQSFTPMLAEMYEHLKSEYPTHGLELIFVSSDRDKNSFDNYYRSMPWMAIPFPALAIYKDVLSMTYGVRGIPSLVILDAMSGQVVVSSQASRREVMEACRRGEDSIVALFENWLQRVPAESRELLDMLAMSCRLEATHVDDERNVDSKIQSYLKRNPDESRRGVDPAARIKVKFAELVQQGLSPNEAAAKAITIVSSQNDTSMLIKLEPAPLDGRFHKAEIGEKGPQDYVKLMLENGDAADLKSVLSTALKYVENAKREPWTPKFRSFKLSNKVADRIVRVPHGLELLFSLGLDVIASTPEDFCAYIPLDTDLEKLHIEMEDLLTKHT